MSYPLATIPSIDERGWAMSFWVYMLRCENGSIYVGQTDDLERRLAEHGDGVGGAYTAENHPVQALWAQEFPTRVEAMTRERQIKNWSRAKKEALARGDWEAISRAARGRNRTRQCLPRGL